MDKDLKLEDCQLMFGDCLERMREIQDNSIDMILCDLPYNTTKLEWDNIELRDGKAGMPIPLGVRVCQGK